MIQIAESSGKKIILYGLLFLMVVSAVATYIPFAKADSYQFVFDGPVDESTAIYLPSNATVTVHYASGAGADENFSFNAVIYGQYIFNTSNPVKYFSYDYNNSGVIQHREFWLDPADPTDGSSIYWVAFSMGTLSTYTISFMDQVGLLQQYPYIEIRRNTLSAFYTVEKRVVDVQNVVIANLEEGSTYQIRFGDGTTKNVYGNLTTTSTTGIQLILRGVDFPKDTLLLYQYIHAYAIRDFLNPVGAITISFEDTTNKTNSVYVNITDTETGTVVFSDTFSGAGNQTFSYTYPSAVNATDYEVVIVIDHQTYGVFDYKQYLYGEHSKADEPFSLSFLGSTFPVSTAVLIPALLIIFVAGCFSELSSEAAAVITVLIAVFLSALGWIEITQGALISALALAVMAGVVTARRRMQFS